ncbi:hypothetical protein BH24ACT22_BH24ACT22_13570 [soil metagenome]
MEELRRLRKERGLTQRGLADASGVDPATISLVENGKRRPHLETLDSLAGALGVEVTDLIPKVEPPLPFEPETSGWERRLEKQVEEIPKVLRVYMQARIEEHGRELKDPESLHFRTPESASLWAETVSREGQMWTTWVHDNRDALVPPHDKKSFGEVLLSTLRYTLDLTGHSILTFRELVRRAEKRIATMEGPIDELAARRMKDATTGLEDAQRQVKEMQAASG